MSTVRVAWRSSRLVISIFVGLWDVRTTSLLHACIRLVVSTSYIQTPLRFNPKNKHLSSVTMVHHMYATPTPLLLGPKHVNATIRPQTSVPLFSSQLKSELVHYGNSWDSPVFYKEHNFRFIFFGFRIDILICFLLTSFRTDRTQAPRCVIGVPSDFSSSFAIAASFAAASSLSI